MVLGENKMKIKNLIFSDGKILEYNKELNNVELIFLDYCNNKFKLKFIDVQSVSEKDAIGYDLSNTKLKKIKEVTHWTFMMMRE